MSFNGSGVFTRLYNWVTEQASSPIEIAKLDAQEEDFATGLSNCILRDGTGLPSTAIPWNSQALTGVSNLSAERVTVTGSTVPANGMYLSAANTVAFASNTTLRGSVNSTGNWVFAAPSSGVAMAVTSVSGGTALSLTTAGNDTIALLSSTGGSGREYALRSNNSTGSFVLRDNTAATDRVTVGSAGNVTIAAPSSGAALTVTGLGSSATTQAWSGGSTVALAQGTVSSQTGIGTSSSHDFNLFSAGANRIGLSTTGNVTINAPSSGVALSVAAVTGTQAISITGPTNYAQQKWADGTHNAYFGIGAFQNGIIGIGGDTAAPLKLFTNNTERVAVASAGNVTINAPSSGTALTTTAPAAGVAWSAGDGTVTYATGFGGGQANIGTTTAHSLTLGTNNTVRVTLAAGSGAVTFTGALSGITTINASGTITGGSFSGNLTGNVTGNVTGNADTATKSFVPRRTSGWADGECLHVSAGQTLNTSDMAAGRTFSILNVSGSTITITQGAGVTMYWTSTGGSGTRTLAARGMATIRCESGTEAYISGNLS